MSSFKKLVEMALNGKTYTIWVPTHLEKYGAQLEVINSNDMFWGTDLDEQQPEFNPFYKHIYLVGTGYRWLYLINADNISGAVDELVDYYEMYYPDKLLSREDEEEIRQEDEESFDIYLQGSNAGRYIANTNMNDYRNFKEVETDKELTSFLLQDWIDRN